MAQTHSGRFVLRIATDLHHDLTELARDRNVSLNQYIQNILASHVAGVATAEYCLNRAFDGSFAKVHDLAATYIQQIEEAYASTSRPTSNNHRKHTKVRE